MRKALVLSVATVFLIFAGTSSTSSSAQYTGSDQTPTFYRWTPGTYVNGYPRFTIHYPKDWVERLPGPFGVFRASAAGPVPYPTVLFSTQPGHQLTFEWFATSIPNALRNFATEVALVGDKPSKLRDGTPAREIEINMIVNGAPHNVVDLVTKKGDLWISMAVESRNGKVDENLKAILYSIEFQPGKDEPVEVPADVQEFLDSYCSARVSRDLPRVMSHYSDRYLNSGVRKGETERFLKQGPLNITTTLAVSVTEFVPAGDTAHLAGFGRWNGEKWSVGIPTSIIKENGEWKWYGNQRDPAPDPTLPRR
jgi:hypothetical protein